MGFQETGLARLASGLWGRLGHQKPQPEEISEEDIVPISKDTIWDQMSRRSDNYRGGFVFGEIVRVLTQFPQTYDVEMLTSNPYFGQQIVLEFTPFQIAYMISPNELEMWEKHLEKNPQLTMRMKITSDQREIIGLRDSGIIFGFEPKVPKREAVGSFLERDVFAVKMRALSSDRKTGYVRADNTDNRQTWDSELKLFDLSDPFFVARRLVFIADHLAKQQTEPIIV